VHEKKLSEDPVLFFLYQLAEKLHKTLAEISAMPVAEWLGWLAYFELQATRG
jgi:hypothetical protein